MSWQQEEIESLRAKVAGLETVNKLLTRKLIQAERELYRFKPKITTQQAANLKSEFGKAIKAGPLGGVCRVQFYGMGSK